MCRPPRRTFWPRSPSICKVYRPPVPLPCFLHHAARRRVTFSASSSEQPTPAAHWKGRESAVSLGRLCPQSPLCFSFCSGHWWTPTGNGGEGGVAGTDSAPWFLTHRSLIIPLGLKMAYLGLVWLCSFDELVVPRLLLLVSLHAEGLVIPPQMRPRSRVPPWSLFRVQQS